MRRTPRILSALAAGIVAFAVGTSPAHAGGDIFQKCRQSIAKAGLSYSTGLLKLYQKCKNADLKSPGSCAAPDPAAITKLQGKLSGSIMKGCPLQPVQFEEGMGFPGVCAPDPTPLDLFSLADVTTCIQSTHDTAVNDMLALEYDATATPTAADLSCQTTIAKAGESVFAAVQKAVQACRLGLSAGKLSGFSATNCGTSNPKTAAAISKAVNKAEASIQAKCTDQQIVDLKACTPDQTTAAGAATCEALAHQLAADNPAQAPLDVIDFQFATPASCGDGRVNEFNEECDLNGSGDAACPGQCGDPAGLFACLCENIPRQRVIEHANADLDNGWTGFSHDSGVVEGGGYVVDLYDCDNVSDFDCNVGPSCSLPPHSPCGGTKNGPPVNNSLSVGPPYENGNTICSGLGQGTCRKSQADALGPHCALNFQQECDNNNQCPGLGDFCVTTFHGAPLPLSSGGVSVCVVNTFTEDVVGTTNVQTGAGSVRLRQQSATFLGTKNEPCPICGGYCNGALGVGGAIGARTPCSTNADCPASVPCITANTCSYGPNADQSCRPGTPIGGPTEFFGNPSLDCPVGNADGNNIGTLDILFNPATTGTTTLTASVACDAPGFGGKTCFQGANDGRACTLPADCPGGSCINQCFCPTNVNGVVEQPNSCQAACLGGGNDMAPCALDSECPGGFCHNADCRVDPTDHHSSQEGICTVGPSVGTCSVHAFQNCSSDSQCHQPFCSFCQADNSETCQFALQHCFVNGQISRSGTPGPTDRVSAAIFCIPFSKAPSVNSVAGLPGPGAITQPTTTVNVGF